MIRRAGGLLRPPHFTHREVDGAQQASTKEEESHLH
jgi:hypothetical protein